ncbi:hypothetical protein IWW41_002748, partial [Coemansia sp. RSA 2522]
MADNAQDTDQKEYMENVDYSEDVETKAGEVNELDETIDPELEELKNRMLEMEKEAQRLRELEENLTKEPNEDGQGGEGDSDDADARSIYVGNVDYVTTPEELQEHFKGSGAINR